MKIMTFMMILSFKHFFQETFKPPPEHHGFEWVNVNIFKQVSNHKKKS